MANGSQKAYSDDHSTISLCPCWGFICVCTFGEIGLNLYRNIKHLASQACSRQLESSEERLDRTSTYVPMYLCIYVYMYYVHGLGGYLPVTGDVAHPHEVEKTGSCRLNFAPNCWTSGTARSFVRPCRVLRTYTSICNECTGHGEPLESRLSCVWMSMRRLPFSVTQWKLRTLPQCTKPGHVTVLRFPSVLSSWSTYSMPCSYELYYIHTIQYNTDMRRLPRVAKYLLGLCLGRISVRPAFLRHS
jgi:hypothetical protein